ncbi:hypothetical protein Cgig2_004493 [Carnegiea gigantea]|uniref:FAR1 domain-containing protein n=1 Tax=Carnegiea gigantea TaxID=171969 RepID=A0A9Q1JRH1_9CARY|nr:hypothetical protein Cgig2_004493 [Carnegiea gigantea]
MFITFNSVQDMEGVDPIEIVNKTQCIEDIMDDLVSEEKQNEGTSSNFIGKRLDDLDENDMKTLIFKTPVECEVFYFIYAKAVGFGVIRETPRINRHGMVTSLRFCCDREGARSEKDRNRKDKKRKARDETRCLYEDNSINLKSSPPSPEEASAFRIEPPSSNGLLHYMPSLYKEGEASMKIKQQMDPLEETVLSIKD